MKPLKHAHVSQELHDWALYVDGDKLKPVDHRELVRVLRDAAEHLKAIDGALHVLLEKA